MKIGIKSSIILAFTCSALACDPASITKLQGENFLYPKECHIAFGKSIAKNKSYEKQIDILEKQDAINKRIIDGKERKLELKDLSIKQENMRVEIYKTSTEQLNKRINTLDKIYERNKWLYFGIGVLATGLSVYAAGQLNK